jgi:hypothetical protein
LGNEYDYEGKYEGNLYKANSTNPKSSVSFYPSAFHATADDPTSSSTSAGNPDLGILSSPTSCRRSTSIDPKGVKTILLPKLVLALLANPPAHSTAFAFLTSRPASSLLVADTGATDHMIQNKSAFISYKPATGCRVRMGNNLFAPILGTSAGCVSSSRALNNRQRLFYSVNGLHQPTGEKKQGPFPPNPLSDLLGSLHVGTCETCE